MKDLDKRIRFKQEEKQKDLNLQSFYNSDRICNREEFQLYNRDPDLLNCPPNLVDNITMFNKYKLEASLAKENKINLEDKNNLSKVVNKKESKNEFSDLNKYMEEILLKYNE